ncbi:hypothetical protein [Legionella taurinensis]|uniref:Uncharacterized protein n=1 Tax=Legionella taurinensis TaxID=70611 RepID=A0A3A5L560_9GAMM|nr:hypothetical protein [Legionella taurinensis]RJT47955.1 hypothetical protein D6J04_05125 [Legionella taurinensis]RJT68169.1 hypothetical protein D6J03_05250 [Legionella taurinensis]STY25655.1 Uncharacterised protein [Legionella taurinensis]
MGKATDEFRKRDNEKGGFEDCREFSTWYDNEDAKRIAWTLFTRLPESKTRALFLPPQVVFDGIYNRDIGDVLNIAADWFRKTPEHVRYFPFIFKPELAGAHYMAGVFVKVAALGMKLVLFNPAGQIKHLNLTKLDKLIPVYASPHALQTAKKDGGKLVSCGPLSLYFLEYVLNNPNWLETVDERFLLPNALARFNDEETYKDNILTLRNRHDELLQTVSDEDLNRVSDFYEPFDAMLLSTLDTLDKKREREALLDSYDFYVEDGSDDEPPLNPDESLSGDDDEQIDEFSHESSDESPVTAFIGKQNPTECPLKPKQEADKVNLSVPVESIREVPFKASSLQTDVVSLVESYPLTADRQEKDLEGETRGVQAVRTEIERLRKKTGLLSWGCMDKSNRIQQALTTACTAKGEDVRLNPAVREALGAHRIGFFGKAQSLIAIDESLANEGYSVPL